LCAAFAVGATLVALLGVVAEGAPLAVAAVACALTGVVTMETGIKGYARSKARAASCRD